MEQMTFADVRKGLCDAIMVAWRDSGSPDTFEVYLYVALDRDGFVREWKACPISVSVYDAVTDAFGEPLSASCEFSSEGDALADVADYLISDVEGQYADIYEDDSNRPAMDY